MKRLTAQQLRKLMPVFQPQTYSSSEQPSQYLHDLLLVALHKRRITQPLLCMNELIQIIGQLKIPLRTQQMSQVYLYATYQRFQSLADTKKKLMTIVNQQKKKVDVKAVAQWLHQKITKKQIIFVKKQRAGSVGESRANRPTQDRNTDRLPSLIGTSTHKLQDELKYLIQIFQQMEQQRQNSGLVPLKDQNDDSEVQIPHTNIPYDPQLYDLNNKLSRLRIRAQQRLSRIIQLARDDPRIRRKLQEAIERFQRARIEANEKVGRMGAMKAQERLNEKKRKEQNKLANLQLGENQNLVHATRLYALLTLPQIKRKKLII